MIVKFRLTAIGKTWKEVIIAQLDTEACRTAHKFEEIIATFLSLKTDNVVQGLLVVARCTLILSVLIAAKPPSLIAASTLAAHAIQYDLRGSNIDLTANASQFTRWCMDVSPQHSSPGISSLCTQPQETESSKPDGADLTSSHSGKAALRFAKVLCEFVSVVFCDNIVWTYTSKTIHLKSFRYGYR